MEQFLATFLNINIWQVAKVFVLLGLGVYLVFAFIVVRQVRLMTEVVSGILTSSLRLLAQLFFLFALAVFIFTWLFL
ncbi:MAG TPA: DUF5657 family protein [Clostridia bacterium]|nr:DUF5657 family protein [Clostridia bacterium]